MVEAEPARRDRAILVQDSFQPRTVEPPLRKVTLLENVEWRREAAASIRRPLTPDH